MDTRVIYRTIQNIGYLHEFWHYLPARLFGAKTELHPDGLVFEGEMTGVQYLVIILTPAWIGILGLAFTVSAWPLLGGHLSPYAHLIFWCGWLLSCWNDLQDARRFLKDCENG